MASVAYSSPFVPPEWVAAHGFDPVRLAPDFSPNPAPAGVCPFAHDYLQTLVKPRGDRFRAAIFTSTCDPMRRLAEFAAPHLPTYLLHVPATSEAPSSLNLYVAELQLLADFLLSLGGSRPTREALIDTILTYDAYRRQDQASPTPDAPKRLALTGGPLRPRDRWIVDYLMRAGATVVLDATEYADRALPALVDESRLRVAPLEELARAYFFAIPDPFRRPDTLLHDYLRRQIAATRAQALLVLRPLCCDQWHGQVGRLKTSLNVPVFDLELPLQDGDRPRMIARLDAVLDTLR